MCTGPPRLGWEGCDPELRPTTGHLDPPFADLVRITPNAATIARRRLLALSPPSIEYSRASCFHEHACALLPLAAAARADVQNFDVATTEATAKEFMNVALGFDETQYGASQTLGGLQLNCRQQKQGPSSDERWVALLLC